MPARLSAWIVAVALAACPLLAGASGAGADPLAAIDLNRNAIVADIVQGFEGDRAGLAKRLAALRADRLLSASLASARESLESTLLEAEKSRDVATARALPPHRYARPRRTDPGRGVRAQRAPGRSSSEPSKPRTRASRRSSAMR